MRVAAHNGRSAGVNGEARRERKKGEGRSRECANKKGAGAAKKSSEKEKEEIQALVAELSRGTLVTLARNNLPKMRASERGEKSLCSSIHASGAAALDSRAQKGPPRFGTTALAYTRYTPRSGRERGYRAPGGRGGGR